MSGRSSGVERNLAKVDVVSSNLIARSKFYEENMRELLLNAFKSHAKGHIDKHLANIEVYLANPAGIGEHSDIIDAIEIEMKKVAEYDDLLEMVSKYLESK